MSRPKKIPSLVLLPDSLSIDLFAGDVERILTRNRAPQKWLDVHAEDLLTFAWLAGVLKKPERIGTRRIAVRLAEIRPLLRETFVDLYAESPDLFLKVLTSIRLMTKRRFNSPEFSVAAEIFALVRRPGGEKVWTLKYPALADLMSKHLGLPVTARTAQHAVELLRKSQPFKP